MIELIGCLLVAGVLWPFVIRINRRLASHEAMDAMRPKAADVAAIEATLPRMKGDNR